jgi:hypothetical protein
MIASNTEGTVVIVSSSFMVMRNDHQCGKKKESYKKNCKAFVPSHSIPLILLKNTLNFAEDFVKKLFAFLRLVE